MKDTNRILKCLLQDEEIETEYAGYRAEKA